MQNLQVGENLRDHRHRSHRHAHGQNDDQRNAVAVRTGQRRPDQPRAEGQPQQKGKSGAHNRQPAHFAALFAAEQLLRFRPGEKHQQQQSEPVHKIENVSLVLGAIHDVRNARQPAQQRRPQHDAGQYLADHLRLPQLDEQIAQQLGEPHQQQEREKNRVNWAFVML